jgi:hypothetical protein
MTNESVISSATALHVDFTHTTRPGKVERYSPDGKTLTGWQTFKLDPKGLVIEMDDINPLRVCEATGQDKQRDHGTCHRLPRYEFNRV